ncbi:hypothetical protein OVS_03745 [Mycoplasma ovis str. Michigan]|uniref:Group II intron maturase-specific domain-containing protein n=1 Tax=Mycoplasma ovis str. Michigan TaxID=1415773 RepID=A0ABN4BL61_9MOLU|nr:hypothetical protein [Mycoplasma ovis]AHC40048.1 hypothetical protein OVS_03745 [Mycoplasma ovis str. Michigan]
MKFFSQLVKKYTLAFKLFKKNWQRRFKLVQLKTKAFVQSVTKFFVTVWNWFFVFPYKFVAKWWDKLFWRHLVRFCKWLNKKTSFFRWKNFAGSTSGAEKERYQLFVNILGGWKNVVAFKCKTKSWHLKITHSFLIDWDKFPHFGIKVLYWEWPYLSLAVGSYAKWIYKRLRKATKMPAKIRKSRKHF